ncbi:hypothetical protein [Aquimarina litoralis]|uniref:hypothetical protein n=1 Tax=Aquimarina litoralis TaxID=584605 RepID=UPI001C57FAC1|nr:hypothetical protein [Aquimarina litoralis]MBW1295965.1 hypothetical protein [Aquimarina litoralis]
MKSITKITLLLGLSLFTFFTSCSEEDVIEELTGGCVPLSAVEDYSRALERYNNDPSVENCEAFKAASIAYLNELDQCPLIEDADLEEALQDASELNCEDAG